MSNGFIDGEGCFRTNLTKSKDRKIGWKIYTRNTSVDYVVHSLDEITKIIIHFNKYPLLTQKQSDFLLWKLLEN